MRVILIGDKRLKSCLPTNRLHFGPLMCLFTAVHPVLYDILFWLPGTQWLPIRNSFNRTRTGMGFASVGTSGRPVVSRPPVWWFPWDVCLHLSRNARICHPFSMTLFCAPDQHVEPSWIHSVKWITGPKSGPVTFAFKETRYVLIIMLNLTFTFSF